MKLIDIDINLEEIKKTRQKKLEINIFDNWRKKLLMVLLWNLKN